LRRKLKSIEISTMLKIMKLSYIMAKNSIVIYYVQMQPKTITSFTSFNFLNTNLDTSMSSSQDMVVSVKKESLAISTNHRSKEE